jgi:hypothetical protein
VTSIELVFSSAVPFHVPDRSVRAKDAVLETLIVRVPTSRFGCRRSPSPTVRACRRRASIARGDGAAEPRRDLLVVAYSDRSSSSVSEARSQRSTVSTLDRVRPELERRRHGRIDQHDGRRPRPPASVAAPHERCADVSVVASVLPVVPDVRATTSSVVEVSVVAVTVEWAAVPVE